jgi:TrmH family RNA methyltransferase
MIENLGLALGEGKRLVIEALASGISPTESFISTKFAANVENADLLAQLSGKCPFVFELPDRVFATITDTSNSQGVIVLAERPENRLQRIESGLDVATLLPIVLFFSEINNPANLGAMMRTAEAAGAAGMIVSKNSADAFSPRSIRASMGSAFRIPVVSGRSFDEAVGWARSKQLRITAASTDGSRYHDEIDWKLPRMMVFGSEAHGLTEGEISLVDETVGIPMAESVESLNLAVAGGIILFEARRQMLTGSRSS